MTEKLLIGEAQAASPEDMLVIEQFLNDAYRFRQNILNGKVEFATLPKADNTAEGLSHGINDADLVFHPLTKKALNSIVIRAKRENVLEKGNPKTEIADYVDSDEIPVYNPPQAVPIHAA